MNGWVFVFFDENSRGLEKKQATENAAMFHPNITSGLFK